MQDQEREHFLQQIQDLERANRGWKLLAAALGIAFALMVALRAAAGFLLQGKFLVEREELHMERERAMVAEEEARMQAEQAHQALRSAEERLRGAQEAEERARQELKP
jgi:hypothetical protein